MRDDYGCTDTARVAIKINNITNEISTLIPNAISPNGDGINDEFYGKGDYIKKFEMMIFDRWGNRIFATEDYKLGWDGRANFGSEVVQRDVYVWKVELLDKQNRRRKFIGNVTLVN